MNRRTATQDLGAGRQRTRVTIISDPCEETGQQSLAVRQHLLESIAYQRELTQCGFAPFQKLRLYHSGEAWVVEAEATTDVPQGSTMPEPAKEED